MIEASEEDDQCKATDFIVLKMEAVRIACRIRRHQYWIQPSYRNQFTMRSKRPTGTETELAKVLSGWGHYFFYGFADQSGSALQGYTIMDLNPFRLWFHRATIKSQGQCPGCEMHNHDASSTFRVFNWSDIPQSAIVAQKLS